MIKSLWNILKIKRKRKTHKLEENMKLKKNAPRGQEGGEMEVKSIKLTEIAFSKLNPRKHIDEVKLKELAVSIKEKGIMEPVFVRAQGKGKAGPKYELICGERRIRASNLAKLKEAPCIIWKLDDKQVLEFMVIENLQRDDLDPIDEATGLQMMIDKYNYTQEDLAGKIGKTQAYISLRLKILALPDYIKNAVSKDIIVLAHAVVLLRISDPGEQESLFDDIIENKLSARAAENELSRCGYELSKANFDTKDCKTCQHNGSSQKDLFDKDTDIKARCLNKICFNKKSKEHIEKTITKLKAEGANYMEESTIKKKGISANTLDKYQIESLKKNYKDNCLANCPSLYYVFVKAKYSNDRDDIVRMCTNSKCFRKLMKDGREETAYKPTEAELKEREKEKQEEKEREEKRAEILKKIKTGKCGKSDRDFLNCLILWNYIQADYSHEIMGPENKDITIREVFDLPEGKVKEYIVKAAFNDIDDMNLETLESLNWLIKASKP